MNEDLNLLEILKDAPKGTKLYCTIWGEMGLVRISAYCVTCKSKCGIEWDFKNNGHLLGSSTEGGECVLFPSKEQRDWSKFKLDLPIDTPVMVHDYCWNENDWGLRYYSAMKRVFVNGFKSSDGATTTDVRYIVPVKDFDFNDPKSNIQKSIC